MDSLSIEMPNSSLPYNFRLHTDTDVTTIRNDTCILDQVRMVEGVAFVIKIDRYSFEFAVGKCFKQEDVKKKVEEAVFEFKRLLN